MPFARPLADEHVAKCSSPLLNPPRRVAATISPRWFLAESGCQESPILRLFRSRLVNGTFRRRDRFAPDARAGSGSHPDRVVAENSSPNILADRVPTVCRPVVALIVGSIAALGATPEAWADRMSTSPEQAYDLGETASARSVGMGGALNGLGVSTTALYLNPANMAMARVYHLEAQGAYSPQAQRQMYGLAIVDSVMNSNRLSGGVAATWNEIEPSGLHRVWTDVRAGLAMPLGDHLALGVTGRWLHVDQATGVGPLGPFPDPASDGTSNSPIFNGITLDLGATAAFGDFRLGVSGHNLTNPGTALAPTTLAGGIGWGTPVFAIEADGMLDFTTFGTMKERVMLGGELFLADRYALRAGWRYDTGTQINAASVGFGYVDPRWSIEIGLRHDLVGSHAGTLGILALRYFYDATGGSTTADEPDPL
jgi:hypothetical protein